MPTALLPNGQTTYVQSKLEVSVALPGRESCADVERVIRQGLADDPRQLFVRVQGGGGYGPWCFWIQWGKGGACRGTSPVLLREDERSPEAILLRVKAELVSLKGSSAASPGVH